MFQIEWVEKALWQQEAQILPPEGSKLRRDAVRKAALLEWQEHCLECAIPVCFASCSLYVPRADKKCSRFVYGIYPNPGFRGLFDFGADVRFRRWGKLEAIYYGKSANLQTHRFLDKVSRFAALALDGAAGSRAATQQLKKPLAVLGKTSVSKIRERYLAWGASNPGGSAYDAFVLECFSPEKGPVRLLLEYSSGELTPDQTFIGQIRFRHSFDIMPGWNFHTVPARAFETAKDSTIGKLALYPENNTEPRLVFTWLDLVQYREPLVRKDRKPDPKQLVPAPKVKCVAWDLDNTLWRGILAEDSEKNLIVRPEALELIKKLDERGIIQTVVSKNNHADAWRVIERLGLQDYFLYPGINWAPKSSNLKQIAARLNIHVDAFVLIDDSAFERAEVQSALPQVRVYSEDHINHLLTFSEFDVPITEASRNRRMSYVTEMEREKIKEQFGENYEAFLRSCGMKLRLSVPREERQVTRCLELIQRSNQLNLSSIRYGAEEFRELLARPGFLCVAMDCRDRFGDYGIVGFASVDENPERPILRDLVLSCRVAQKRVEHTVIQWLAKREFERGKLVLAAELVRTERNKPICQVFDDLRFQLVWQQNGHSLLELRLDPNMGIADTVVIQAEL